jgi:hypothetical protein
MTELHNHLLKISGELGKAVDLEKIDIKTAVNLNAMLSEAINFIPCCTQLLCVNTHETWDITENKLYKKIGENQREYIITDDKGKRAKFFKRHFEEIQM